MSGPTPPQPPDGDQPIFHLCAGARWRAVENQPRGKKPSEKPGEKAYGGSPQDRDDGFIHFSTRAQAPASAARHRAGERDLVLLEVDPKALGPALRWEPSRGGALFPHLYGPLPLSAVRAVHDLPLGDDGRHVFPPGFPPLEGGSEP